MNKQETQTKPVDVSGEAMRALSEKMRQWSGWPNARLLNEKPKSSPWAECRINSRTFVANLDALVLNPHRVLHTVTPFRLRQEAVLTGALLHEVAHARFSTWRPITPEGMAAFTHGDGQPISQATMNLAMVMEEPRIEGLMAGMASTNPNAGATGLEWTMRASAAHLVPMTPAVADPDQAIMDLIVSWALRAGRQWALERSLLGFRTRSWARDFTRLLSQVLRDHLHGLGVDNPYSESQDVYSSLMQMIYWDGSGDRTFMVDTARSVLETLFPETPEDERPQAGGGCAIPIQDQGDESQSEGESDEQEADGDQPQDSDDEPGEGDSEDEAEGGSDGATGSTDEDQSEEDTESEDEADQSGDGQETEADQSEAEADQSEDEAEPSWMDCLRELEDTAQQADENEAEHQAAEAPTSMTGAGTGGSGHNGGWRPPTKEEREIQKGAERFLRDLVNPTETAKVTLSESPAATVDGAALASWKAGGMVRDPMFFRRTRREVQPCPPVKIAVLVDVSGSMDALQKPSAVLSWALASAALDLRNFAGRGQQVESCLIHWGSSARVIQRNGEMIPGIREVPCIEGTMAMHQALDLVEQEIPGFFDIPERAENRLLVQFTDWEIWGRNEAAERLHRAFAAGVNMLSVVPGGRFGRGYAESRSELPHIISTAPVLRGKTSLLKYNPMFPDQVWEHAAENLI